jgi:RNA polymerase sigma-70 factor (family 1)
MGNHTSDMHWFKEVFDKYYEYLRNYLYYLSGDITLSEDIAQDVFLKLWERQEQIRIETVKPLLFTIARNLYFNHHKRSVIEFRFTNTYVSRVEKESPDYLLEMKEFDKKLQRVISNLPEKCRTYYLLNRIDDMKYTEIAESMGVSVKAVEKQISKAMKILKKETNHML